MFGILGQVISKYNNRSYIVKDENGNSLRRNRRFLNQTNNSQFKEKINFENNNSINSQIQNNNNNSQIQNNNNSQIQNNNNNNSQIIQNDQKLNSDIITNTFDQHEVNDDMPRGSNMITRSGRTVKPPAYLQDFVLT